MICCVSYIVISLSFYVHKLCSLKNAFPPFITGYVIFCNIYKIHANVIHNNVFPVIPALLHIFFCKIRISGYLLKNKAFMDATKQKWRANFPPFCSQKCSKHMTGTWPTSNRILLDWQKPHEICAGHHIYKP